MDRCRTVILSRMYQFRDESQTLEECVNSLQNKRNYRQDILDILVNLDATPTDEFFRLYPNIGHDIADLLSYIIDFLGHREHLRGSDVDRSSPGQFLERFRRDRFVVNRGINRSNSDPPPNQTPPIDPPPAYDTNNNDPPPACNNEETNNDNPLPRLPYRPRQ